MVFQSESGQTKAFVVQMKAKERRKCQRKERNMACDDLKKKVDCDKDLS